MKNSNSRGNSYINQDKNMKTLVTAPTEKLMKTDIQQPRRQQLERTNYNRPASGKKIQSVKNLPPKGPVPKKEYIVEDNMTQSRINQAKQGLQLLKKKMSAKGLSREKAVTNEIEKPVTSMKTVASSKGQDTQYYQNRNSNMPPKKVEKKYSNQDQGVRNEKPSTSTKASSNRNLNERTTPQNQKKQPPPPPSYQEYRNESTEIPIKPKKDFNALLEQELRKEKQMQAKASNPMSKLAKSSSNQMDQYPPADSQLIQCRHCERMFGQTAIQKHEKICLKVFMSKRKAFDSAAHRAPEVEGIQQIKTQTKKQQAQQKPAAKKQPQNVIPKKQEGQIPKWKAASLAFRANLKALNGGELTKQQKKAAQVAQGLVQCNHCGRKFNQKAAQRHIPFCQTKSKQLPKMNTTTKKK